MKGALCSLRPVDQGRGSQGHGLRPADSKERGLRVLGSLGRATSRDQTVQSRLLDLRAFGLPWLPPRAVTPMGSWSTGDPFALLSYLFKRHEVTEAGLATAIAPLATSHSAPALTAGPQHPQSLLSGASCDRERVISHDAVKYSINLYLILSGSLAHSQKSPGKPFADKALIEND